jgi:hypothetical protein
MDGWTLAVVLVMAGIGGVRYGMLEGRYRRLERENDQLRGELRRGRSDDEPVA